MGSASGTKSVNQSCGVLSGVCKALVAWHGVLFWSEGEIEVLSCIFSTVDAGRSVCVCMYVYMHTHST